MQAQALLRQPVPMYTDSCQQPRPSLVSQRDPPAHLHVCLTSTVFLSRTSLSRNTHFESRRRKPLAPALSLAVASRPRRSAAFYLVISLSPFIPPFLPPSVSLLSSFGLSQPNPGIQNGSHPQDEQFIYCAAGRPGTEQDCMAVVDPVTKSSLLKEVEKDRGSVFLWEQRKEMKEN